MSTLQTYTPSKIFAEQAHVKNHTQYTEMYKESINHPDTFWAKEANELHWQQPWSEVLEWNAPDAKWFVDAKVNITENCLDRHIRNGKGDNVAIIAEKEDGTVTPLTYKELHSRVCKLSNILLDLKVKQKDTVIIYMPMIAEAVIAMLACARIGAVHSVVFGGFSADSVRDRLNDSKANIVITADGGSRRGKIIPLKAIVDEAVAGETLVQTVLYYKNAGNDLVINSEKDKCWNDLESIASDQHTAEGFDAEHPLFILYTSGSTGKPKGILHTTGGYMVGTYATSKYVFDLKENDVYWCTADVGWITGHSYITYGPLLNGATQVVYEGAPNHPDFSRFWKMVESHKVSIFYTAPTAVRAFVKAGDHHVEGNDLSSLRLLGSVGEPINPKTWQWYYEKIGNSKCPIVDTWWQTETGAIMISPLPGATTMIPGKATNPFFGVDVEIVDEQGNECEIDQPGKLLIKKPWPSMLRGIYGDRERYVSTYWSDYKGAYLAGDNAIKDKDGNIQIIGRLDDVLNVSGHRLGTAEVESALVSHPSVAESAVVGHPHEIKGESIHCFVILHSNQSDSTELEKEIIMHVGKVIGAIARPDAIYFIPTLPKTRSGKIMRRLLRELLLKGTVSGNLTTLEDPTVIDNISYILKKR